MSGLLEKVTNALQSEIAQEGSGEEPLEIGGWSRFWTSSCSSPSSWVSSTAIVYLRLV